MSGFGGGGGFNTNPFGNPAPAAPFGSFGAPPAPATFGSTATPGFASPPAPPTQPFGQQQASSSTFGTSNPFGGSTSQQTPQQNTGGFGGSSGTFSSNNPFGGGPQQQSSGFGQPAFSSSQPQQQQQQTSNIPNPFGGPPSGAPSPAVTFGRSSNVVTGSSTGGGTTFAASSSGFPSSTGGFGDSSSSGGGFSGGGGSRSALGSSSGSGFGGTPASSGFPPNPFGQSSASSMPFSSSSTNKNIINDDEDDMMGGSNSNSPIPGASPFSSAFPSAGNSAPGSLSPVHEDTMGDDDGAVAAARKEDDELAKLKAKIEAKKKKLMERQKQKQGENQQQAHPQQQESKGKGRGHRRNHSRSTSPLPSSSDITVPTSNQDRAARNAVRFAATSSTTTSAFLPSDLKSKGDGTTLENKTTSGVAAGNREDLASAKSLEGTCMYMCPDEELLRRERENDIQLLEIPDPGGIHPPNWTLRNTAVKRFRRSAADYKLDVPEWVRSPDALEEVCSYLEEWVMEKDRQGPDKRFPQNGTPNSLDVYQFIWDRTRMIRKDFILQNYVGTGGKCDARAVRCHERIARWHAMCEHQLSHISDFVVHQSQQNIQELGQAMKTLNQYYDDSLGRSTVEVPDEEGRETRTDLSKFSHGCKSDVVRGGDPVDYDGTPLNNAADASSLASNRLIGNNMVNSPAKGTAEPEMRGLYILLTMNNDGGMEVMRYSAKLYRERPEIYNSKPVQLALDIFKAKKDYNYVRFFAILRDPDTPYLFACVMFKHVELMRKAAFRIMSNTYGAKKKDSGEPIYDAYPLKKLAQTLCFEDIDEARAACEHYNITIKEMKVRSSSSPGQSGLAEIVFWRHSDFKEPKDPDKGTMIPCRPKKMMKYIESKLKGATRLGVCRGEVSGEGASLSSPPLRRSPAVPSASSRPMPSSSQPSMPQSTATDQDAQTDELFKRQQELFRQQQAEAEKAKAKEAKEKRQRQKEEHERQEALKKEQEQAAAARKVAEEARREKESEEKRKEQEAARRAAEEEARRQNELEEQRRREAEEAARKLAEEQARKQRDLEEKRKREEEEKRQAQIRAEQERKRREEEERLRKEEERKRLEALRRQEEERRCREAEALKKAQEIQQRVDNARKILILRRWREKLPWKLRAQKHTAYSLGRIDPTFSKSTLFNENPVERGLHEILSPAESSADYAVIDTRRVLNRILAKSIDKLDVSSMMLDALCDDIEFLQHVKSGGLGSTGGETRNTTTILLKVAVLLPEPEGLEEQSMYELIHTWLHRRLGYGTVHMLQRQSVDGSHTYNARILFSKLDTWSGQMDCDAALVAIPPSFCNGDWDNTRKIEAIASAFACLDEDTPRTMYVFGEESSPEYFQDANEFLASCLPEVCEFPVVFPSAVAEKALDGCLHSALKTLVGKFVKEAFPPLVEQVSVMKLAASCIRDTLWRNAGICSLEVSRACLTALAKALDETRLSVEAWSGWPAEDFAGEGGLVRNYFGKNLHLPSVWTSSVFLDAAKTKITDLCQVFQVSVPQAVYKLVRSAPANIQDECEEMLHARQYRKCIQHALQWGGLPDEIFYLPKGTADSIAKEAIESILGTNGNNVRYPPLVTGDDSYEDENVENEDPNNEDNPPRTPEKAGQNARTDRDNSCFHKPQDIFAESRTVSPVAPPMMTTPTPGMVSPPATGTGVYESPPAGVMSNKRSWAGMAAADDEDENDDGRGGAFSPASATKRFRKATSQPVQPRSRNLTESSAFTKKLQALLNGESTVDMDVGGTTLARLLRDAPPINEVDLER